MNTYTSDHHTFVLIMAGGSGTRFWPLSRQQRPKQLLPFANGRSLIAATAERLEAFATGDHTIVVTNKDFVAAVRAELPTVPAENILAEPTGRDTAACVGWVAWRLARQHPDAVIAVLPADHIIPDGKALCAALSAATQVAVTHGALITLGLRPTRPETGYGYLELGETVDTVLGHAVARVHRFVEKPNQEKAELYLAAGNYRWNSGMFVWTVAAICAAIRAHLPELANGLDALMADCQPLGEEGSLAKHYPTLPKVSIDFGVMEKASNVLAIPVDFAWYDVGSWQGLAEVLPEQNAGVSLGDVVQIDSSDCVLISDGPMVTAVGVHDLVVVATRDAVLVIPKEQSQRVKELVEMLQVMGRNDVLL